jgi:hypothetical protein
MFSALRPLFRPRPLFPLFSFSAAFPRPWEKYSGSLPAAFFPPSRFLSTARRPDPVPLSFAPRFAPSSPKRLSPAPIFPGRSLSAAVRFAAFF